MATFRELGEFGFIDKIARHGLADTSRVVCGIGDDCAVFEGKNDRVTLVTTDLMVEEVHFKIATTKAEHLGCKLLSVNLSDIAAMGGEPREAVVSLAVPGDIQVAFIEGIYSGLHTRAKEFDVNVVGGDTTASPGPLVMNLTLTGEMEKRQVCYRSGASPGDLLYVSGTLGDSLAGLKISRGEFSTCPEEDRRFLQGRHHDPTPRVALGQALAATGGVSAMMDLSDGLSSDLGHICGCSGVSAAVRSASIPVSDELVGLCEGDRKDAALMGLSGGEDYELLFTVAPEIRETVEALGDADGLPKVTWIGQIEEGSGEMFLESETGERSTPRPGRSHHFS